MGTKNNPKNRGKNNQKRKFNGKEIEPVLYYGNAAGHGKYMAAKYIGTTQLVFLPNVTSPAEWSQLDRNENKEE
jgi:hypothetical protein